MRVLFEVEKLVAGYGNVFKTKPLALSLQTGVIYLTGGNGSGKTSLMRTLSAELQPLSGSVKINGKSVHDQVKSRRHIALASSSPELPGFLTVKQACQFAASLRAKPKWNGDAYCEALNLPTDLLLSTASAGQRRKAELICALAGEPEVILLDETFAHLDTDAISQVCDWINNWRSQRLLIMTHHGELPVQPDQVIQIHPDR